MTSQTSTPPIFRGLAIGILGVLAVAIAPILLTRLYETGRINAEGIGIAICIEFIAMALGSLVGAKVLSQGRLSLRLTLTCIALAASNIWTPYADGNLILAARALAGLFGGMMIWVAITSIIRSATPEKWSGVYLSGHTAVQFATAAIIAALVVPSYGASGGYWVLGLLSLVLIPVALSMPNIRPLAAEAPTDAAPRVPMAAWLVLASVLLLYGMFSSVISYAEVEFQTRGFNIEDTLVIVPVMLLAQIIGGICAAVLAPRLPKAPVIIGVCIVLVATLWWLTTVTELTQVYAGFAIFGFCWLFVGPFHLGLLLRNSLAPQTAELVAAAQLFGLAFGPLAAAGLLLDGGYPPAFYHFTLIGASLLALVVALAARSGSVAAPTQPQRET